MEQKPKPKSRLFGRWKCPKCGRTNGMKRSVCRHCGAAKPT